MLELYDFLQFTQGIFLYDFIVLCLKFGFITFVFCGLFKLVFSIFKGPFNK